MRPLIRIEGRGGLPNLNARAFAVVLMLAMAISGQLGCDRIDIKAESSSRDAIELTPPTVVTPSPDVHDLAITAIDFDPALKPGFLPSTDNITLLVAIENKGNSAETDVVVEANLQGMPDLEVLVSSQATVKEIAPGENLVVRFGSFSSIPLRSAYSLRVDLRPVAEEAILANNSRSFRLDVTVSSR